MWTGSPLNTYQCSHVGIGLLVQQKLSDSVVATVSCNVQCREVVQCDIINRRLVLQQQFHAFYVVALGWHVQRGQSILCEDKSKMWYRKKKKSREWYQIFISDIYVMMGHTTALPSAVLLWFSLRLELLCPTGFPLPGHVRSWLHNAAASAHPDDDTNTYEFTRLSHTAEALPTLYRSQLLPWFWHRSEHLGPAAGPPYWCCLSWRPHGGVWSHSNQSKNTIRFTTHLAK